MRLPWNFLSLVIVCGGGCAFAPQRLSVTPGATFAAHQEHQGLAFDRLTGGGNAVLRSPGLGWPGTPAFFLERDGQRVAAFSVVEPATVDVRAGSSSHGPVVARVVPEWENNAIRLTLQSADGATLKTDLFARVPSDGATPALTRLVQSTMDLRGTYRATLRDTAGADVGWLGVRVGPYLDAPRIYDGSLPDGVSPELGAATTVALASELDWIEAHSLDPYRGTGDGLRGLSLPSGR